MEFVDILVAWRVLVWRVAEAACRVPSRMSVPRVACFVGVVVSVESVER